MYLVMSVIAMIMMCIIMTPNVHDHEAHDPHAYNNEHDAYVHDRDVHGTDCGAHDHECNTNDHYVMFLGMNVLLMIMMFTIMTGS